MTIMARHIDIGCNGCGEWRRVRSASGRQARRNLRSHDWIVIREGSNSNDLCPACAMRYRAEQLARRAERQRQRAAMKRGVP
jgi:hypothetical protein